ncbi:general secretion pathway protein GspK [Methylopila turkensis]|uniref:T2SS protein K first SAM-like domain-containing protein n=1 Tax=Methylopila turkensis TaxID=1437816 RepID=A0A9W6JPX1_9HYPH|nr:type II secretion system protein GspK [Methylopila turkensis]GLK79463.1 hypothetical protein GCM10008174_12040 [Methylopila turkensis]
MRRGEGGFVLVSALAVLAVLAGLVVGAGALARSSAAGAIAAKETLARDALANAGLELAAYQIFVLRRAPHEVSARRIRLDGGTVEVSVASESGKVDLNGADKDLLAGLWRSVGLGTLSPEAFAARIMDWRDADDQAAKEGAERPAYQAAGRDGPADAPFQDADDLRHVLGVGVEGARALKRFVTVANPEGRVAALAAPLEVLRALPKVDGPTLAAVLRLQRSGGEDRAKALQAALQGKGVAAKAAFGPSFAVTVRSDDGVRPRVDRYVLMRSSAPDRLYDVIDFERDPPAS